MKREFLKNWEKRQLNPEVVEISAIWDPRTNDGAREVGKGEVRIETREERRIALDAVVRTLSSLFLRLPACLAIVGRDALHHLDEQARNHLLSMPNKSLPLSWSPGDHDFVAEGPQHSLILELHPDAVSAVGPFFLGLDPRCILIFSKERVPSKEVREALSKQRDHLAAIKTAARLGAVLVYPALDGDVVVFITRHEDFARFIMTDE